MVVMKTYLKAMEEGDKKLYFIDGFATLGNLEIEETTVDGCHPTSLGFYNIAKSIYDVCKGCGENTYGCFIPIDEMVELSKTHNKE